MNKAKNIWAVVGTLGAIGLAVAQDVAWEPIRNQRPSQPPTADMRFREAVARVGDMVQDPEANRLVRAQGLDLINLTWEDTGRYQGSAVGPNISDMTIQVGGNVPARAMPVIRYPNFSDRTADLDPRDFTLLVGNERGRPLRRVSLREFLERPRDFLANPRSWPGARTSLLAPRDERVLVSAQACFLPVPRTGKATFNPVLFNYQSVSGDPAVLTVLATREGTSVTVIDNKRDAFAEGSAWGQRLFFNRNGQRTSLTGERLSDFRAGGGQAAGSDESLSMVLLIQIPLKQRFEPRREVALPAMGGFGGGAGMAKMRRGDSDVETAVIGHGRDEGPFTEIDNLPIERDGRFPVRVTVQFYKATSNGVVNAGDVAEIKRQIDRVYAQGDAVGSLVTEGRTGRITEYDGPKVQPAGWWEEFWRRHEANTGDSRDVAIAKLRKLLGNDYRRRPVTDLYLRDQLRKR